MQDKLFSVAEQVVVVIAGREADTLAKTAKEISTGEHAVACEVCDVAKPEDVARLVKNVVDKFGHIDTLVSVAGVNKRMKAEDYSAEEYDWIVNINLRGAFMLAQAVGRHMIGRKSGAIINVDSLNTYAPLTGVTPYAISKAGVLMMTRSLANEWGKHGVRVNSIAPGFFPTALSAKMWAQEKMTNWAKANTPLGKLGDVRDLVGAAIYLASPASAFVTGQTLRVDGGVTAGISWPIEL
jgi:gluconate 5-dehydrogenase